MGGRSEPVSRDCATAPVLDNNKHVSPSTSSPVSSRLQEEFGAIDIYLFDQLLKGQFDERRHVLDAGCGSGRNLPYFLRNGFSVYAIDSDPAAIAHVRRLSAKLAPSLPAAHFITGDITHLPWHDNTMDAVISSAVLHFAEDEAAFSAMLREMWRVLKPGGVLFARLASTIGLELPVRWIEGRRARLPDGGIRFLVDERFLTDWTAALGGRHVEPIKTTNVQNQRCMTTWVVEK
jgi:tellurite methyltransferase